MKIKQQAAGSLNFVLGEKSDYLTEQCNGFLCVLFEMLSIRMDYCNRLTIPCYQIICAHVNALVDILVLFPAVHHSVPHALIVGL